MPKFHTSTPISDAQATGTQRATVQAENAQEAAQKVEELLQDQGWTTGRTDVYPGR
ncbi:hypothetical protein [Streptomyces sp. BE133]|uniref:hypothetical protein n=1 Tax=Streptomyces sp. BE133 TaxID=3002523 RepID=UPI002E78431F|nr:hypothetical protein [Streptomyces sp. BE133]MEE1812605.1 hypothetical protein [Streptomyces sp. BE133]